MILLKKKKYFFFIFIAICFLQVNSEAIDTNEAKSGKAISILINNLKSFSADEIIDLIGLGKDTELNHALAKRAKNKIIDFYKNAGFLRVKVTYQLMSNKELVFNVIEGRATLVRDIRISDIESISNKKIKAKLKKDALDAFGIKRGDFLSKNSIRDGLRALNDWIIESDFLTAGEPKVKLNISNDSELADIAIEMEYGPRIRFGFRNNKQFSYRELLSFVTEVKEIRSGEGYIDRARERIIDAYKEVGLVDIKVKEIIRLDSEKGYHYVSFVLDEGERIKISDIGIDGIYAISEEKAIELFFSYARTLVKNYYFHDAGIREASSRLLGYMRSLGYLSAKLNFVKYDFDEKRKNVRVKLFFAEGVQTYISSVNIEGVENFSKKEIGDILKIKEGIPFDILRFEDALMRLRDRYRNAGYLTMEIANKDENSIVKYFNDNSSVDINLILKEGPLVRVGDIAVRGNSKTNTEVILRELPFFTDDVLRASLIETAEDSLWRLGLFSSVAVQFIEKPNDPKVQDVLVLLTEDIPGRIEVGYGYRNDSGLRFFSGVSYKNLGGWNRSVALKTVLSRRLVNFNFLEYNVNLNFREPYIFKQSIIFLGDLIFLKRSFSSFDVLVSKARTEFRKELTKKLSLFLEYSFENTFSFNIKGNEKNEKAVIGAITPGFRFDSRDNAFNPKSGIFSLNRFELASSAFGSYSDIGYYRTTSNNSAYFSLTENITFNFGLNFGFERSNVKLSPIPKIKLFRLGGISSLRGYREDSLEVETKQNINGTLALVNYRSELQFPLFFQLGFALFWDAGNLFIDTLKPFELRHSAGVGLRYNTPVGPVNLDVAYKLGVIGDRKDGVNVTDQDRYKIHFSIGKL